MKFQTLVVQERLSPRVERWINCKNMKPSLKEIKMRIFLKCIRFSFQFFLQNYVSLVPSASEKLRIIGDILNHILCKETANITCNMSDDAVDNDIRSQLNATKEMNFCIVVHCTERLREIFLVANEYDLLGTQYRWFLLNYVAIDQTFEKLPENLMLIELTHYDDQSKQGHTSCGNVNYLDDALVLIANLGKDFGRGFNRRSNGLRW